MESEAIREDVRVTVAEYLRLESEATDRHEYRNGRIVAMSGGTAKRSLITANVIRDLGNVLKGKSCSVYDSNLRIRTPRTPLYTYPDISVVCGDVEFDSQDSTQTTITNPLLIVEVLSQSTEAYDRGEKFRRYLTIESLKQYVLVSQDCALVETFLRQSDGTLKLAHTAGLDARVRLDALNVELALSEIYARITFLPDDESQSTQ